MTCSAGNHGKAVAYVARELGLPATIYVPRSVDESKYQGMLALGAKVVRSDFDGFDETEALARASRREDRAPVRDPRTTTIGSSPPTAARSPPRSLEDAPAARSFLLPVGGAGLAGGFAFYAKAKLPDARIVGCQHALSPALRSVAREGRGDHRLPPVETTAGGLEGGIGRTGFDGAQGPHRRRRAGHGRAISSTPCASCSTSTST